MSSQPSQTQTTKTQSGTEAPTGMFYPVPDAGVLLIAGPDQQDFLQRQTTNDLGLLTDSTPLVTVLTSPTARILDVLTLVKTTDPVSGEGQLLALTLPGRAEATAAYLNSKIFFMDNVTVVDVSGKYGQTEVIDPGAAELVSALGFQDPNGLSLVQSVVYQEQTLSLVRQEQLPLRLLMNKSLEASVSADLQTRGGRLLSAQEFETARIEAGRPGPSDELTTDYTPLENNLKWAISETKGCYTGQEVIARQITYDKITRKLVGLQMEAEVAAGAKVWAGKQAAGSVTSTTLSGRYGPIALAMIKRPHYETGAPVTIGNQESGVAGTIVNLPFSAEQPG